MEVVDATDPKEDDQKAKDDARYERMQRMLAQKQAQRQRQRTTGGGNKKTAPAKKQESEKATDASNSDEPSTNADKDEDKPEKVKQEEQPEEKKQEEPKTEANEEDNNATSGNKSMTAFEKMQARMASRQKDRKEGGGPKKNQTAKKAVKVEKKIDPLTNTKPLIIRNSQLRSKRTDIVDVPKSDRQSVDRSFEVGELVYFVSKDDNQYVSGTLSEFKTGGFWKIEKIVNPNNRNPALEEGEDPSRYVRTKPPTIKPEGYYKLMSPHDFEVEFTLEFAHMLRDYMKDILKKKEKVANYTKQKEKALARIGKTMNDDIPSAIGGSPSGNTAASKAKGPTPFQQKKMLQKQNTTAITTGISQFEETQDNTPKTPKSPKPGPVTSTAMKKRKSMSNVPTESDIVAWEKSQMVPPPNQKRRSVANLLETGRHVTSRSQTTLNVMDAGDSKKKEPKEKRVQPKGKVEMPSKPVEEWTVSDVQEWLMNVSTRRPRSKEKKKKKYP